MLVLVALLCLALCGRGVGDSISYNDTNGTAAPLSNETGPLQPLVTLVKGLPSSLGVGAALSNQGGTPWCGGAPTFWISGHQCNDTPNCLVDGVWQTPKIAVLAPEYIDRHFCVPFDVNLDGVPDIVCTVGAGMGLGTGYNQIFLTEPNGSVTLLPNGHGLQKYPTMRTRVATTLRDTKGKKTLLFIGTEGKPRLDGMPNEHRMFRRTENGSFPYFTVVHGPWERLFIATCAKSGKFGGTAGKQDGLVVCNKDGPPLLVLQSTNGTFHKVPIPNNSTLLNLWRSVRIVDVTRDGQKDLVVVTWKQPSLLLVFRGIQHSPFFDFSRPWYRTTLPFASPDVEVLDVNSDGIPDVYVVQTDETKGKYYCGALGQTFQLNETEVPPWDTAHDVLLVGTGRLGAAAKFRRTNMLHSLPGCGWMAQRWNDSAMLLGQGSFAYSGYAMLLEWNS